MPDSDTGFATLPDIGALSYNGVTFSQLYRSRISGRAVKDNAQRTVKYVEIKISVEGVVTLSPGDLTCDENWANLRQKLNQQAATLIYSGKGFGRFEINVPGGVLFDVAWGPKPEVLDFVPLGSSRSAMISWTVTTCIPEATPFFNIADIVGRVGVRLVQFNFEDSLTYNEDGYSSFTRKGTMEIPLTRPTVDTRTIPITVDQFRRTFLNFAIDLTRFRVTNRSFQVSRDKRVMEWSIAAEELPYQGMPPWCTVARGSATGRNVIPGPGMAKWMCSLRATYTVRKDQPRRIAWWAFIGLLHERMWASRFADPVVPAFVGPPEPFVPVGLGLPGGVFGRMFREASARAGVGVGDAPARRPPRAIPWGFSWDEGLYLDSKTVTFEAQWVVPTTFTQILLAAGTWRKSNVENTVSGVAGLWALSMQDITGASSWLFNELAPTDDVIVDMGGGL